MTVKNIEKENIATSQGGTYAQKTEEISDSVNKFEKINLLEQKVKVIEERAAGIEGSIKKSEVQQNKTLSFMFYISGAIVIAFFLAGMPIFLDYYRNNFTNYKEYSEKFIGMETRIMKLEEANKNKSIELINATDKIKLLSDELKKLQDDYRNDLELDILQLETELKNISNKK